MLSAATFPVPVAMVEGLNLAIQPVDELKSWKALAFLMSSMKAAKPKVPKTYFAPVPPFWPAFTISAQATLSGKGRLAS